MKPLTAVLAFVFLVAGNPAARADSFVWQGDRNNNRDNTP